MFCVLQQVLKFRELGCQLVQLLHDFKQLTHILQLQRQFTAASILLIDRLLLGDPGLSDELLKVCSCFLHSACVLTIS